MTREVIWTWAAEMDAQEAFARREESFPGSGGEMVALLDGLLGLLRKFPRMAPEWCPPLRRLRVGKTSLGLFYVVEPGRLVIVGLQDLRRDPEAWKREILRRLP